MIQNGILIIFSGATTLLPLFLSFVGHSIGLTKLAYLRFYIKIYFQIQQQHIQVLVRIEMGRPSKS